MGDLPTHIMQFALGWTPAPTLHALVRLTSRFRGRVIRELLLLKSGGQIAKWSAAPPSLRDKLSLMVGKDRDGHALPGHQHTVYLAWCENQKPTRLLVFRPTRPFDPDEQEALLRAAQHNIVWASNPAKQDAWSVRLIPLDRATPPPPFLSEKAARIWESHTPYVLPRHHLRKGRWRAKETIPEQIRRELVSRGIITTGDHVDVTLLDRHPQWMSIHVPQRQRRHVMEERLGYWVRLEFQTHVRGPLLLGHSASFGLGLFVPVEENSLSHATESQ